MDAAALTAGETDELLGALERMALLTPGGSAVLTPLAGGVSSLIVKVELAGRSVCIKRALPQLKVASVWKAPVERSDAEAAWIRTAAGIVPRAVPTLLGQDVATRAFVMEYLDPTQFPVWKTQLLAGHADPATARAVAASLVAIHNATANSPAIAAAFPNAASFHALRLDPYFAAAATRHPQLRATLHAIIERTAATRLALIHGDVSPKNILVGAAGPILLDAECATHGDPAFDLAFCLNHLLLKCVRVPQAMPDLLACYDTLANTYLAAVRWEPLDHLLGRACTLLPALLLARIDGKSPVEYLTDERDRDRVRRFAIGQLRAPGASLEALRHAWSEHLR